MVGCFLFFLGVGLQPNYDKRKTAAERKSSLCRRLVIKMHCSMFSVLYVFFLCGSTQLDGRDDARGAEKTILVHA